MIEFTVDGVAVKIEDTDSSVLGVLRDDLGLRSAKDGCSPQGQCGCCTVFIDGLPRVACVTPARRIAGRTITTLDGFEPAEQQRWADAFCATGASQCGFCTPGIAVRLAGLEAKNPEAGDEEVRRALTAHLCRCTGWQTIVEAWNARDREIDPERDFNGASTRATIEGRTPQQVSAAVALGHGGFADDDAPDDALVAVLDASGNWVVGETVHHARIAAGKVQGRRTTLEPHHPIDLPDGDFDATLQTTWIDPAYLETDSSWAAPSTGGGPNQPASVLANGGAFGAKLDSPVAHAAADLANEHGRPVRALFSREDSVRFGPKRPPVAGAANADGTGVLRVAATPGIADAVARVAPGLVVEQVELTGPLRTSADLRAAGWAEATALLTLARGTTERATGPEGGWAQAEIVDGAIVVTVGAGDPLDEITLRSYCIGAAHMAWSWVTSEALTVDADGEVHDLTVRSFGVARASDTPRIDITIDPTPIETAGGPGEPSAVNGSDAVFVAVAAATALHFGASRWPHQG